MSKANKKVRENESPEDNRPLAERLLKPMPVKSSYLKIEKELAYWLNGTAEEHNVLLKLATTAKTRQEGFEKAVWSLACDKNGEFLFKGKVLMTDFHKSCDKVSTRYYGMLILGFDSEADEEDEDGNSKSLFDKEIDAEVKK